MELKHSQANPAPNWQGVLNRSAAIATLIGVPFIILLMYCAWLPLMMGMYFFILGGMLVGAIWFRLASRVRPVPAGAVRLRMVIMLVLLTSLYLVSEYYVKVGHLTRDMTELTIKYAGVNNTLQDRQARELEVADHVRQSLRRYGPGPLGYWIWAATNGQVPPMEQYTGTRTITLPQNKAYYVLRVVFSVVLLGYGLRIMVKDLAKVDEPVEIAEDALGK